MARLTRSNRWQQRLAVGVFSFVAAVGLAAQQSDQVNTVRSIRTAAPSGAAGAAAAEIELELHSTQPFPILDQVVVLRIGDQDFLKSRSPEDGSLNTLFFMIPANAFEQLPDGARMTVRYGVGDPDGVQQSAVQAARGRRWDFGTLDKSLLAQ